MTALKFEVLEQSLSQWISEHGIYQTVTRALGLENGCDSPDQRSAQHSISSQTVPAASFEGRVIDRAGMQL